VLFCGLLLLGLLLGCAAPVAQADPNLPLPSTAMYTPSPTVTFTATPTATPSPTPTPTNTPTPIPTISIPLLTRTLMPTDTPTPDRTPLPLWELPERVIPEPFGVNIHFTQALPGELSLLAGGGFRWVRMDLLWNTVEQTPGHYDFREYDALVTSMAQRGIRILFILDYGNPLYDYGFPPHSPEGRTAFARFAAAAARHYRGKGIIWEIWNEPNLNHFWPPQADVERYGALLLETADAIRRADPTAFIVAPATSGYDWPFWTALGKMGAFEKLDAVTVHSYGLEIPEQVGPLYIQLAAFLRRYSPAWKLPVLSSEWGYTSVRGGISEEQQAQYLVRQWLVNLAHDVNLSIWYDWRNDGVDPAEIEQNFGTVDYDLVPKPAYYAARTLLKTLDGYRFMRRIPLERPDDYLLLFQKEMQVALALWTTGEAHTLILPLSVDDVKTVMLTGVVGVTPSQGGGLAVAVDQSPRYLLFREDQSATFLGGWRPVESLQWLPADGGSGVHVIFDHAPISKFGEIQVRVQGTVRGTAAVVTHPMEELHVYVPVDVGGLQDNVPAEVIFIPPDGAMLPLQSAAIWLLIGVK